MRNKRQGEGFSCRAESEIHAAVLVSNFFLLMIVLLAENDRMLLRTVDEFDV